MNRHKLITRINLKVCFILLMAWGSLGVVLFAQQGKITVKGVITDQKGLAIPGVNIIYRANNQGTITDMNGAYSIQVAPQAKLEYSFTGFKTQTIAVKGRKTINVVLAEDLELLQEVVVVGYGSQKKVNLTGSVAAVNMSELTESRPVTSVANALSGMAAGVSVTSGNNSPAANGNSGIRVRGEGTLNNSAPLVIIDGVEGDFNSVNPQDIEQLSVLKDAASASIYGSRAANGVILITTKKGKAGKVTLSYNGYMSAESVGNKLHVVSNFPEYMDLMNEGLVNSGQSKRFTDQALYDAWVKGDPANPLKYPNSDWQDALFRTGISQQHNLTVSGGNEKTTFFMSYNYLNNPGVAPNTGYLKNSLRLNVETEVTAWLKLGTQLSGYVANVDPAGEQSLSDMFTYAWATTPGMVHRAPDGRYGTVQHPQDDSQAGFNNVYNRLYNITGKNVANNMKTRFYARISPLKGLSFEGSYTYAYYDKKVWTKPVFFPQWNFLTNTLETEGIKRTSITNTNSGSRRDFMDGVARYQTSFLDKNLNFSSLIGTSQEQYQSYALSASKLDLMDPSINVINGAYGGASASGSSTAWAMLSYFGRMNLDWKDKYLLEMNVRADASSRFLKENRWGYFPSVSLGWRVTEEDYMKNIKWLSSLKLRGSYGSLGNNSVGNYDAIAVYSQYNYALNDLTSSGVIQSSIPNPNLTWETTYITDLGMDFGVFNNHLTGTFDYFNKVTKNILINLPAPAVHGTASIPKQNAAQVRNKGWELTLGYNGKIGNDFTYGIQGNITHVKNVVEKFKGGEATYGSDNILREGLPMYSKYVLVADRIVQTDADVAYVDKIIADAPLDQNGKKMDPFAAFGGRPKKGDILYKDENGDGLINNDDRKIMDYSGTPDWTYGLNLNAAWKGIDFSMLFQGSSGAYAIYNLGAYIRTGNNINADVIPGRYYDGRDVANDPATYPRLLEQTQALKNNMLNSTFWMESKAYMRIKNIQLGYTIPKHVLSMAKLDGVSRLRFYASLENYFTFTDWKGLDPEVAGVGYPVMRQATLGINLTF